MKLFLLDQKVSTLELNINQTWKQNATTIARFDEANGGLNELGFPNGIFIDHDQTIYVTDTVNDRIVEWKRNSDKPRIVAGGNGRANQNDQLNWPMKAIVDQENDSLIICDAGNRKVMR